MDLALTINRHPQSAFQPTSSFHKKRELSQLDRKLDTSNEQNQLFFNTSSSVFEDERHMSDSLLNLKAFKAKAFLELCHHKESTKVDEMT